MASKMAGAGLIAALCVVLMPVDASACPICFGGDPDSQIARSMNWAVFTLLGITGGVLSGFVGFIFHLIKRSRMALGQSHDQSPGERFNG
jgi:hypothetical protein